MPFLWVVCGGIYHIVRSVFVIVVAIVVVAVVLFVLDVVVGSLPLSLPWRLSSPWSFVFLSPCCCTAVAS